MLRVKGKHHSCRHGDIRTLAQVAKGPEKVRPYLARAHRRCRCRRSLHRAGRARRRRQPARRCPGIRVISAAARRTALGGRGCRRLRGCDGRRGDQHGRANLADRPFDRDGRGRAVDLGRLLRYGLSLRLIRRRALLGGLRMSDIDERERFGRTLSRPRPDIRQFEQQEQQEGEMDGHRSDKSFQPASGRCADATNNLVHNGGKGEARPHIYATPRIDRPAFDLMKRHVFQRAALVGAQFNESPN